MLTLYMNDIEGFDKDDWGDMLDNPRVPVAMKSAWENWRDDKRCVLEVRGYDPRWHAEEWESFPVNEFAFDLEHDGEKVEYSGELSGLLADIVYLNDVKRILCGMELFDRDFGEEMDNVLDSFLSAHDNALARALFMLLKELYVARKDLQDGEQGDFYGQEG